MRKKQKGGFIGVSFLMEAATKAAADELVKNAMRGGCSKCQKGGFIGLIGPAIHLSERAATNHMQRKAADRAAASVYNKIMGKK